MKHYSAMYSPELAKLLHQRKMGDASLIRELHTAYMVRIMPKQHADARDKAVQLLQEYDKKRITPMKVLQATALVTGIAASAITIYAVFK